MRTIPQNCFDRGIRAELFNILRYHRFGIDQELIIIYNILHDI